MGGTETSRARRALAGALLVLVVAGAAGPVAAQPAGTTGSELPPADVLAAPGDDITGGGDHQPAAPNARALATASETAPRAASSAAIIDNGTVQLGVNPEGHLNVPGGQASSGSGVTHVGLRFIPTGAEATAPGCLCEGWGAADAVSGVTGYANVAAGGVVNLDLQKFETTASSAVSEVTIDDRLRVTHDFHATTATPNLYEVTVEITNLGADAADLRYRRVMDWDVEPTAFAEYSTIEGSTGSAHILGTSNNGFASANPLEPRNDNGVTGFYQTGDFTDAGPADHGALFDFGFDDVPAGETVRFNIFYGGAPDAEGALDAVSAVHAETWSLGKPSTEGNPASGAPNTFVFAFNSVGGDAIAGADLRPPVFLNVFAPSTASRDAQVPVRANLRNVGTGDAEAVGVRIVPKGGLTLAPGQTASVAIGELAAGATIDQVWTVVTPSTCGGGTYPYDVYATYHDGTTEVERHVASQIVVAAPAGGCAPPSSPTGLAAQGVSNGAIQLTWTDASNNETYFELWYRRGTGSWMVRRIDEANRVSYLHAFLGTAESVAYTLKACNANGCSPSSNYAFATSENEVPPAAPDGLIVTTAGTNSISLSWRDRSSDETRFDVAYDLAPGSDPFIINPLPAGSTSWTHTGLSADTAYVYRVRACRGTRCSAWTPTATGRSGTPPKPAAPSAVRRLGSTASSITVGWYDNSTTEDRFVVAFKPETATDWQFGRLAANSTWALHNGLTEGARWNYAVRACNGENSCSDWVGMDSAIAALNDPPSAPSGLYATEATATSLRLNWSDNSSAEDRVVVGWRRNGTSEWREDTLMGSALTSHVFGSLLPATSYDFFVKACRSTSCSPWSAGKVMTTQLGELVGLEVSQAVQDLDNFYSLVKKKTTIVRAYVHSPSATRMSGRLRGYRSGSQLTVGGGLNGLAPLENNITVEANPLSRRGDGGSSMNFVLPAHWLTGTVRLVFESDSGALVCKDTAKPTADDCSTTVTFEERARPRVNWVRLDRPGFAQASTGDVDFLIESMLPAVPADEITGWYREKSGEFTMANLNDMDSKVNKALEDMRWWDRCWGDCDDIYYGAFKGSTLADGTYGVARFGKGVGTGVIASRLGNDRHTHTHEIAHIYGLEHAVHSENPRVDRNGNTITAKVGWCGEQAASGTPDWPYKVTLNGRTGPGLGHLGGSSRDEVWGVDSRWFGENNALGIVNPNNTFEMMGYCSDAASQQGVWSSGKTYLDLWNRNWDFSVLATSGAVDTAQTRAAEVVAPTNYLVVRGGVDAEGDVTLSPFGEVTSDEVPESSPGDQFTLELRDAEGAVLSATPFGLVQGHAKLDPDATAVSNEVSGGTFIVPVPRPDGDVAAVAVVGDGTDLAVVNASANPPSVSVVEPAGGADVLGENVTIRWSAQDVDGDDLTATVLYSKDEGATWQTLEVDVAGDELVVPRSSLAGSQRAIVRVVVSDGMLAATADSEPFTVADNAPSVSVARPTDGAEFLGAAAVTLSARANDAEDGILEDDAISWSSDREGPLGTGRDLVVSAEDLSTGAHVLTVAVTDSAGNVTTATASILIGRYDMETPDGVIAPLAVVLPAAGEGLGNVALLGDTPAGGGGGVVGGGALPERSETSDAGGDGAGAGDVVELTVTTREDGPMSVARLTDAEAPAGYVVLGRPFQVVAPDASAPGSPLKLVFLVDLGEVPPGVPVAVFRDGELVAPQCSAPGVADPDPCISSRRTVGDDLELTVLSMHASVWTAAIPKPGSISAACLPSVPESPFVDVPRVSPHAPAIDCIAARGIALGVTATEYRPGKPVTRGQMASFVVRFLDDSGVAVPDGDASAFRDTGDHTHGASAAALASLGIVQGTGDGRFEPDASLTRAAFATMLAGAYELATGTTVPATGPAFDDVDGNVHADNIAKLAAVGITTGTGAREFSPDALVTRQQMASFLARALNLEHLAG